MDELEEEVGLPILVEVVAQVAFVDDLDDRAVASISGSRGTRLCDP